MEILSPLRNLFLAIAALVLLSYAFDRIELPKSTVVHDVEISEKAKSSRLERRALAEHISKLYRRPLTQVRRIVDAAYLTGAQRDISPTLLLAIAAQESSFNPQAQSRYGAQGLMQVVPRFHPEKIHGIWHPDGLKHPESNIDVGAQVLKEYWTKTGNLATALRRYSGGANEYAQKVFRHWSQFEKVRPGTSPVLVLAARPT